jgi:hypothetical protein
MTLTSSQLAEIRAKAEMYPTQYCHSDVMALLEHVAGLRVALAFTDQLNALCAKQAESIASLETQLSTVRQAADAEATAAERERAAGIAETTARAISKGILRRPGSIEGIGAEIAQAIRAPTGDEGK